MMSQFFFRSSLTRLAMGPKPRQIGMVVPPPWQVGRALTTENAVEVKATEKDKTSRAKKGKGYGGNRFRLPSFKTAERRRRFGTGRGKTGKKRVHVEEEALVDEGTELKWMKWWDNTESWKDFKMAEEFEEVAEECISDDDWGSWTCPNNLLMGEGSKEVNEKHSSDDDWGLWTSWNQWNVSEDSAEVETQYASGDEWGSWQSFSHDSKMGQDMEEVDDECKSEGSWVSWP